MTTSQKLLETWITTTNGEPCFENTEEALLYAQLIHDKPSERVMMRMYRDNLYLHIKDHREGDDFNCNKLIKQCLRAHLLRVCHQECNRIEAEVMKEINLKYDVGNKAKLSS